MQIKKFLFKQYNTGSYIGAYIDLYTRTGVIISVLSLLMLSGTFWNTGAAEFIHQYIPWFTFWQFLLALAFVLHAVMLIFWKVVLPSVMSHSNQQGWKHNNPSRVEFERLHEHIRQLENKLESGKQASTKMPPS